MLVPPGCRESVTRGFPFPDAAVDLRPCSHYYFP